ncbi:hypothetical protein BOS5A_231123 [Bosea sp. EC-HK365B]|nr:hypothetical protein BOSE21B_91196 [Bosea sp. 21B]VVT61855.1 hypothetical protein BOS5A_231123 [Bosea sp. EC-HK365B]
MNGHYLNLSLKKGQAHARRNHLLRTPPLTPQPDLDRWQGHLQPAPVDAGLHDPQPVGRRGSPGVPG